MPFPQHPHCLNELVAPPRLANPARAAAAFLQACRPQALIAPQPHVEGGTAHAPVPASEAHAPTMLFVPPDPPESLTRSFRQRVVVVQPSSRLPAEAAVALSQLPQGSPLRT